jgi:hypothetical protein
MKTKKILFYLLAALLGGCVPVMSLHPLFNEKDVTFNKKLLGTWVQKEEPNKAEAIWDFKQADVNENAYRLTFSDEEGKKGSLIAHLVKLKDKLFLDVCPVPWEQQDANKIEWPYNTLFLIPAHTFIKIDSIDPNLVMRLTDDEKINKLFEQDPNAVEHTSIENKFVLTASTQNLQAFVLKHADDSQVFAEPMVLSRKKAAEPNTTPPSKPDKTSK